MSTPGVTILGLGNLLMQDEGIGVYIANLLIHSYHFDPPIEIIDGGTNGIDLLPYFESTKKVLIIDAVNFEKDPGYIDVIYNDDILTMLSSKISLHHLGLSDVLSLTKLLEIKLEEICLVGIQPHHMELSLEISEEMKESTTRIIRVIQKELDRWHIKCQGPLT